MTEFRVTVPNGDPTTVVADRAQITDGALLLGSSGAGSVPVGLFAAGQWCSAVDTTAVPSTQPVPEPEPTPEPEPAPAVPSDPEPSGGEPE